MSEIKEETKGLFLETLVRNNTKIRQDRAQTIYEDTKLVFRRAVEDLEMEKTRLSRRRDALLDISPTDSITTVPASKDFDPIAFVNTDIELGVEIRKVEIKLEIAKARYEQLFDIIQPPA